MKHLATHWTPGPTDHAIIPDLHPTVGSTEMRDAARFRPAPSVARSADDERRHLTTYVEHAGIGSAAPATPSDSRRPLVNSADWVCSSDASYPSQANRS
jgi:hypothetical protein